MKKEIEKTEDVKKPRFIVLVNGEVALNASKKELADETVQLLQKELKPVIILLDNKEKKSTQYTKTIHQRNYRVQAGNYEKDSVLKPAPEVNQTED